MAERYRFFDSISGDTRMYNASEYADYFKRIIKSGLYNEGGKLAVTADGSTMKTTVDTGVYFFDGRLYENDAPLQLTHDTADATQNRIDLIVLRLDLNSANRYIKTFLKKGTPAASPVAPTLTNTTLVKEIALAEVRIVAGRTYITQADVTDKRPSSLIEPIVNDVYNKATVDAMTKGFGLGSTAKDIGGTDLNNLDLTGFYMGSNLVNAPSNSTAWFIILNLKHNETHRKQIAYGFTHEMINLTFERVQNNGSWFPWDQVVQRSQALCLFATRSSVLAIPANTYTTVFNSINLEKSSNNAQFHYNTSDGTFTVPETGVYTICCRVLIESILNQQSALVLFVNGSLSQGLELAAYQAPNTFFSDLSGSVSMKLNKGDFIQLKVRSSAATNAMPNPSSYLSIARS